MAVKAPLTTLLYLDHKKMLNNHKAHQHSQKPIIPTQPTGFVHSQQETIIVAHPRHIKKYPKSPSLLKTANNLFIQVPLQPPVAQFLEPPLNPIREHRKKGRSMDFECSDFPTFDVVQNIVKAKQSTKNKVHSKRLYQMRERNTVSQLKYYKRSPQKQEKDGSSHKQRSKKSKVTKVADKHHKNTQQYMKTMYEPIKSKKHFRSVSLHNKQNKHLACNNSNNILNHQYKSLELVHKKGKYQHKKATQPVKQIESHLPFPSKLNSLYSNTTSLFCSKSQFEPVTQQTVRIITEQPEQISQIRKYESLALTRQLPKLGKRQISIPNEEDQPSVDTHSLISKYLQFFNKQEEAPNSPNPQTQKSLFMQLYQQESNKTDPMIQIEYQAKQLMKEQSYVESQQMSKEKQIEIDGIIKLISSTEALGQSKKEEILTKIRKIIPIANIGSKQLQIPSEKPSANRSSSPTSSLLQSFPEASDPQLYDLKTLDHILSTHERQLSFKLSQQLQEVQNSKNMTPQQKEAEKDKLTKWTNLLIQQSTTTRLQLWKNFRVAKQILGGQMNKLKNSGLSKSISEQVLLKSPGLEQRAFHKESPKKQTVQDLLEEQQYIEPSAQTSARQHLNNLLKIQKQISQKKDQDLLTPGSKADSDLLGSYKSFYTSREVSSSETDIHNLVLLQSAQKIQYDYQDDSPEESKSPSDARILCEESSGSDESVDFTKQFSLLSPQLNYTHPFTTMTQEQKQDVFEFMFIDLCIELSEELKIGSLAFNRIQKFINHQKPKATRRKGITVTSQTVKNYLTKFIEFVQSRQTMYEPIYQELDRPIGPTALELLGYIRPEPAPLLDNDIQTPNILDISLYEHYDTFYLDSLQIENYYEDQQLQCKRRLFLRNAYHIFNKALFDSMNQLLDQKRPFGQWGEPFNWQITWRFRHHPDQTQKQTILNECALTTTTYTQYYCGLIPDKQQFRLNKTIIPEAHVQRLRNERLFRLLTDYLQQIEQKLQFIQDDKTEVLVIISDWLWQQLLSQLTIFLF